MKKLNVIGLLLGAFVLSAGVAFAQTVNCAPNGAHYNLNIIGVPKNKSADMKDTNGNTIFVPLWGNATINLCDSDVCANGGYQVLDRNGTDADGAKFALPSPDPDGDGTTDYSVFARALGKPNGTADVTTCATDTTTGEIICSQITMTLNSAARPNKFQNVSKYLLYVYAADGTRVPLFGDGFEDFYWLYDNKGLKLAQLRFYQCNTTVPSGTNPLGEQTDNCGRT